jgi:hypothetical protein
MMKKLFLILSFGIIITFGHAQDYKHSLSFFGNYSVIITDLKPDVVFEHEYEYEPLYIFGLGFKSSIGKHFYINRELSFFKSNYKLTYNYNPPQPGVPDPYIPTYTEVQSLYYKLYVGIGHRMFSENLFSVFYELGPSLVLLENSNEETGYPDGRKEDSSMELVFMADNIFSLQIKTGFSYKPTNRFSISVSPDFIYYFEQFNSNYLFENPISYGYSIYFNYMFSFKKS